MSIEPSRRSPQSTVAPENWVDRYGDELYRFALKRLRAPIEAEEAVQETFLAAIRAQHQFTGNGTEKSWLLRILQNKIVDVMRTRERRAAIEAHAISLDSALQFFDSSGYWNSNFWHMSSGQKFLESQELWKVVKICLSKIPPLQADVFVLSVMEEMDAESIGRALNITISNVSVRLHRARLKLAKCVSENWLQSEEKRAGNE